MMESRLNKHSRTPKQTTIVITPYKSVKDNTTENDQNVGGSLK